ncbi:MAG: hypothetical protein R6V01_01480 [Thermoplasmatota archaeon]
MMSHTVMRNVNILQNGTMDIKDDPFQSMALSIYDDRYVQSGPP